MQVHISAHLAEHDFEHETYDEGVALTDEDGERRYRQGLCVGALHFNDCQIVFIDTEMVVGVASNIDKAYAVAVEYTSFISFMSVG